MFTVIESCETGSASHGLLRFYFNGLLRCANSDIKMEGSVTQEETRTLEEARQRLGLDAGAPSTQAETWE
ncbi:hypothetical protein BZM27_34845 [Paraburkholderia steynii]|uniref:Uncharacterized protein n=1 Tax=Paraburkholderia steynii TaxID=1245441 RepID=A0A4R0XGQ0_9BURK|nr:hypothetical protein BZM27_34845 [Paraburkholderia steynii]